MSSYYHSKQINNNENNKNKLEPHLYNIQAKLQNGILSIFVHDTITNLKWRQEFTQISFPGHKLYNVAKSLIMAIQQMINDRSNDNDNNNNDKKKKKKKKNDIYNNNNNNSPKPIAILVYNKWCYLTIHGSNLPSFALRPIEETQKKVINQNKKIKDKDKDKDKDKNDNDRMSPYGFTTKNKETKNITFKKKSNDYNEKIRSNSYSNIRRPVIIVNKGVVARNIARFSQKQNESNNTKKTSSSNSRKSHTKNDKRKTKKHSKKHKKKSLTSKSSTSKSSTPTSSMSYPLPPPRSFGYHSSGYNSSGGYHSAHCHSSRHHDSYTNFEESEQQFFLQENHNLTQPIEPRYSASATNNIRFEQMLIARNQVQPYIPAPPIPKKQIMGKKSQVSVTVIGHDSNNNNIEPGQLSQPGQAEKKYDSISVNDSSDNCGLSGVSHLDVLGCSNFSSSDYDEDDGIMINTDDDDDDDESCSFKHPGHGLSDSNTGSLDSLFTNDGIDDVIINNKIPMNKRKLYDSITNVDTNEDLFECEFSGDEEYEIEHELEERQREFRGGFIINFERGNNSFNTRKYSTKQMWNDDIYDQTEGAKTKRVNNNDKTIKKKKKKGKKSKKKNKRNSIKLTICLNGDVIDDMMSHVIEQQIAEEEYYEEEDALDEPYYDPNYLGLSPYYDD